MTATQPLLAIGEVAARVGIRTSALRYYEAQGLISPDARVGGRRRYRADAVDHLTAIGFCQALGFSLEEIRHILAPPRGAARKARWRGAVDAKIAELEGVARRAEAMTAVLRASRDCGCVDVQECAARASECMTGAGGADADR